MSGVMLATGSKELAQRVGAALGDDLVVLAPEQLPAHPAQVMAMLNGHGPLDVLILDPGEDRVQEALSLGSRFGRQFPAVSVVVVTERATDLALTALRAGVQDLAEPTASVEDLRLIVHRAIEAGAARGRGEKPVVPDTVPGRVITIASPKGGVGKTTLSTNIAVGLAEQAPQDTVMIDLDVQFGDVAAALDLEPESTLADVVHGPAARDSIAMKTLLTRHPSGLHVLCGVKSPAEADDITAAQISTVIAQLKSEFRYVVLDTAPGMSEQTLAALDHTTDLVLITSLDVPGVRGLRKEIELLDELDLPPSTRHVVVNFADRSGGLSVADVEATIGRKVDVVLPRSKKFTQSTNQGQPLLAAGGRDKITKELAGMVTRFAPVATSASRWSGRHRGAGK